MPIMHNDDDDAIMRRSDVDASIVATIRYFQI